VVSGSHASMLGNGVSNPRKNNVSAFSDTGSRIMPADSTDQRKMMSVANSKSVQGECSV